MNPNMTEIFFSQEDKTTHNPELGELELNMYDEESKDWIGYATYDYSDKALVLKNLCIFEPYRGKGLSKKFLSHLIKSAWGKGLQKIEFGTPIKHPNMIGTVKEFAPQYSTSEIVRKAREGDLELATG